MDAKEAEETDYHCYLLRMWRDGPQRPWRASMQSAVTGTRHYFADMTHLLVFLQACTREGDEPAGDEPGREV